MRKRREVETEENKKNVPEKKYEIGRGKQEKVKRKSNGKREEGKKIRKILKEKIYHTNKQTDKD